MTLSPCATQALTPAWLSSTPRPSTCLTCTRWSSSAPSPQPTSSTRERGAIMSAISCRSIRMPAAGEAVPVLAAVPLSAKAVTVMTGLEPAAVGAAVEEAAQGGKEFRLLEQEGVMPLVALDLDEADVGGDGVEGMDEGAALARREQPVAGEGDEAEAHGRVAEGVGDRPELRRHVEIIHGARDVEVGVGVEA